MKQYKRENYIKGGLSLGIFLSNSPNVAGTHTHDFVEIVYVVTGSGIETINGISHNVGRGDMLFINYDSTHKVEPVSDFSYINICFSPETVGERLITGENAFDLLSLTAVDEFREQYGADVMTFTGEERRVLETILFDMLEEYKSDQQERKAVLESYMNVLIAKILRKRKIKDDGTSRDGMWQELSQYILENLDKKLTLNALASKCFYNPSYFSRIFKERYGIYALASKCFYNPSYFSRIFKERYGTTLVDYVTKERVSAAARMLRESGLSADRIAEKCGFGDRTGLYRAFSKVYGMSPAEYRKSSKDKAAK